MEFTCNIKERFESGNEAVRAIPDMTSAVLNKLDNTFGSVDLVTVRTNISRHYGSFLASVTVVFYKS